MSIRRLVAETHRPIILSLCCTSCGRFRATEMHPEARDLLEDPSPSHCLVVERTNRHPLDPCCSDVPSLLMQRTFFGTNSNVTCLNPPAGRTYRPRAFSLSVNSLLWDCYGEWDSSSRPSIPFLRAPSNNERCVTFCRPIHMEPRRRVKITSGIGPQ